ncbi:hypothetical protein RND81_13G101000 [Saponaria officinalis]|uniref:Ionotropic glutamate receptor C-terminal domain-containing protein n=1 Tax=Saponaria officinalis TaxID=3572 RepID=A0AAW1GZ43_SAPOF
MKGECTSTSKLFVFVVAFLLIPNLATGQNNNTGELETLQILIPVRQFTGFVSYEVDPLTGEYNFSGFAIKVFQAVMNKALPNHIPFKFVPFAKPDGSMNGTFDDMLKNVSSEGYHGAVGEISILHSRTTWVDFTMPYLGTSISMLVRFRQGPTKTGLGRSTKYVVASSLGFSFIVALLFWFLEYRNDRHASQSKTADSSPRQSSATNVDDYFRREVLRSIIQTRLVMILFFMVLLVLITCYTASQTTTSLANQPPSGNFKSLNELIRKEANVGYREGSFIRNLLVRKGIDESKLIVLHSEEEMVSMLSKGSAEGGVDAIIADEPNLKILVAKHCDKFTIEPTYNLHAAGFGFAFRKKFERLPEISNGILRLIENDQLAKIQEMTIGNLEGCSNEPNNDSAFLDSDTLWILIAGAIAVVLLIGIVLLIYCGNRKSVAYPCYLSPCC